ncbi:MAG: hypothetical protein JTJ12_08725, partial [Eubacterium sp.]|nr:hypothetical protein [Eubacterium sp.]
YIIKLLTDYFFKVIHSNRKFFSTYHQNLPFPTPYIANYMLLFTPVSITSLIDTEDACFGLNASRPIAKGDLKWRDALLVAHRVNSNVLSAIILSFHAYFEKYVNLCICHSLKLW